MATYTTNLDLIKPAGTDKIRIAQINENMDTLDAAIGAVGNTSLQTQVSGNTAAIANVQNGLAYIVGNTNTTGGTLAVGQFVYVKGHSTISEGLRKVTASISANGSITTSNTDACSEGGLNALNSKIVRKTTSESITTNSSGWIIFPSGRTILYADNGNDYKPCFLTYRNGLWLSRGWHDTTSSTMETFTANTAYTIYYTYMED